MSVLLIKCTLILEVFFLTIYSFTLFTLIDNNILRVDYLFFNSPFTALSLDFLSFLPFVVRHTKRCCYTQRKLQT